MEVAAHNFIQIPVHFVRPAPPRAGPVLGAVRRSRPHAAHRHM